MFEDLTSSHGRIAYLARLNGAAKYLEIGVDSGRTFFSVEIPFKVAVDPCFKFNSLEHTKSGHHFFQITSDEFFCVLSGNISVNQDVFVPKPFSFDVIFIDGLHTFEQSYRDFENSLRYAHEKTLWVIDDTIPCDVYSSMPDKEKSLGKRREAGLYGTHWHGDVYKTIFAIHDYHPSISYCTLLGGNNPQTILWKASESKRIPQFSSIDNIRNMTFYDMIHNSKILMPISSEKISDYIFRSLSPEDDAVSDAWEKAIWIERGASIEKLLKKSDARIQELLHSRSWRFTKPLRTLSRFVRNVSERIF